MKIIETILGKDISAETKEKAIKEITAIANDKVLSKKCHYVPRKSIGGIAFAFSWKDTPSGYLFWEKINDAKNLE